MRPLFFFDHNTPIEKSAEFQAARKRLPEQGTFVALVDVPGYNVKAFVEFVPSGITPPKADKPKPQFAGLLGRLDAREAQVEIWIPAPALLWPFFPNK